jgi:hypothetical protein
VTELFVSMPNVSMLSETSSSETFFVSMLNVSMLSETSSSETFFCFSRNVSMLSISVYVKHFQDSLRYTATGIAAITRLNRR